jgi:hypothetical protein
MEHHVFLTSATYKDKNGMTRDPNHYNAEYNRQFILKSDVVEFDTARYLLNNNLAKDDDILITYVDGKRSLTATIKWFAEHTIEEGKRVSSRFIKWRPFDVEKIRPKD